MDAITNKTMELEEKRRELHSKMRNKSGIIIASLSDLRYPERIDTFDADAAVMAIGDLCNDVILLQTINRELRELARRSG